MGEQLSEYEDMLRIDPATPIHYKAAWLDVNTEYIDLDIETHNSAVSALISYLEEMVSKELGENEDEYKKFAKKFVELYKAAYPKDQSVRRGNDRPISGHTFVNNHLKKISREIGRFFVLRKKTGGIWVLGENVVESIVKEPD